MLNILKPMEISVKDLLVDMNENFSLYKLRSVIGLSSGRRMEANMREPVGGGWFNMKYTRYKGLPQGDFAINSDQLNFSIKVSKDTELELLILGIFEKLKS